MCGRWEGSCAVHFEGLSVESTVGAVEGLTPQGSFEVE
jgi:hypothetical protein